VAIMIATGADFDLLKKDLPLNGDHCRSLYYSRLYLSDPSNVAVVGPMLGAPYAVMLLETLIAWGVRKVIFLGWCGAVGHQVKIGDILIPTGAIVDEGTSKHYSHHKSKPDNPRPEPSGEILAKIDAACESLAVSFHHGRVWTTDAVYRETGEKIRYYQKRDVLAVDMETSALFSVAHFRKVALGGILVVSDELSTLQWKPGFNSASFKQGRKAAFKMVKRLCQML